MNVQCDKCGDYHYRAFILCEDFVDEIRHLSKKNICFKCFLAETEEWQNKYAFIRCNIALRALAEAVIVDLLIPIYDRIGKIIRSVGKVLAKPDKST